MEQRRLRRANRRSITASKVEMEKLKSLSQIIGLHPLTALSLIAVDWVLFGEEVFTAGVGWAISLPVGLVLGLAAILIQRYLYKDSAGPAIAKGLVVALLTAIPAPLSSLGILPMAAFGAIRALSSKRSNELKGEAHQMVRDS